MAENKKEKRDYFKHPLLLECGCGIFHPFDDNPFVTCSKCGFINSGNKEQLAKAEQDGKLMKRVYWEDLTPEQRKKINDDDEEQERHQEELEMEADMEMESEIYDSEWNL